MTKVSLGGICRFGLLLAAGVSPVLAQGSGSDACGILAVATKGQQIPVESAKACLDTIPLGKDNALQTISGVKKYLEFQSTLAYLKKPPSSSSQEALDLLGEMDKIADNVRNGKYKSQIQFETAVSQVVNLGHDGHLSCTFTTSSVISFSAPFAIVSLSKDGTDVPKIYAHEDVPHLEAGDDDIVSEITKLDDTDVVEFLEALAEQDNSQSADTRWNDLMLTRVRNGYSNIVAAGNFYTRASYPGKNSIKVTWANGSEVSVKYIATVIRDLSSVTSGEDIYSSYALPQPSATGAARKAHVMNVWHHPKLLQGDTLHPVLRECRENNHEGHQNHARQVFPTETQQELPPVATELLSISQTLFPEPTAEPTATATESGEAEPSSTGGSSGVFPGYDSLTPIVKDPLNECAGFYLSDDTAVLVIVAFAPIEEGGKNDALNFQKTIQSFLADCKKTKKTKLIIDVHGNGGGTVGLGYDTLKQLFPQTDPFDAQRFRASAAAKIEGEAFSDIEADNATTDTAPALLSSLKYQNMLQIDGTKFKSFDDFFGPVTFNDDKFTHLSRLDLSNQYSYGTDINITGYNDRADFADEDPVFDPKNIVLLTDGVCASTCTIFAEVMQNQLGVKTVAVGGRPNKKSMAAIGGTRGCQAMTFDGLVKDANAVINGVGQSSMASSLPPLVLPLAVTGGVNYCDQIRNNTKDVPLQFIDEPADCRIYYTASTWMRPLKLWKQVHDIKWGNGACAEGGLKAEGSRIGSSGNKTDDTAKKSDAGVSAVGLKGSSIALISALIAAAMIVV